jgi:hypothetical protein
MFCGDSDETGENRQRRQVKGQEHGREQAQAGQVGGAEGLAMAWLPTL